MTLIGQFRILLHGVDEQVGVDILPAVDPEVVPELVAGPGCIVMGAEFGIDRIFYREFLVGLPGNFKEFGRADDCRVPC